MRKLVLTMIVVMASICSADLSAQLNWRFEVSGMYTRIPSEYEGDYLLSEDQEGSWNVGGGLFLQIPLKKNENPFFIETGINFQYKNCYSLKENAEKPYTGYDVAEYGRGCLLQIPVKFGWRKHLKGRNWLELSVGPYASCNFNDLSYYSPQVGINPSVVYRHRCISVGLSYYNPIFYNGTHDQMRNTFMLSFGLNFGNKTWEWIGYGAMAAASVGTAVGTAYGVAHGGSSNSSYSSYNSHNSNSSSSGSSYENGSRSSSSGSSGSNKENSVSAKVSRNADLASYNRYDSLLAMIFAGNRSATQSEIKDIQSKMRALREKWTKRGDGWTKSDNESR